MRLSATEVRTVSGMNVAGPKGYVGTGSEKRRGMGDQKGRVNKYEELLEGVACYRENCELFQ